MRVLGNKCVLAAALTLGLSVGVSAQSVTVPDTVQAGGQTDIEYSNPGLANQSVDIQISNGDVNNPQVVHLVVVLDANGKGKVTWEVPTTDWDMATIIAPDVTHVILVENSNWIEPPEVPFY